MDKYLEIKSELEEKSVTLVAVSKTKPAAMIQAMYDQGQRIFGENRVQELTEKYEALPKDIQWHAIGNLQRNKVKYIAPFISMIHSVENWKLLGEINKRAAQNGRVIDCLLQFHIAQEDTKSGLDLAEAKVILENEAFAQMENIRIRGVMGMATFTDNTAQVRTEFQNLRNIFNELKREYFAEMNHFEVISMGMSGDYKIAIEEGSNMVRIGSLLFGAR